MHWPFDGLETHVPIEVHCGKAADVFGDEGAFAAGNVGA